MVAIGLRDGLDLFGVGVHVCHRARSARRKPAGAGHHPHRSRMDTTHLGSPRPKQKLDQRVPRYEPPDSLTDGMKISAGPAGRKTIP